MRTNGGKTIEKVRRAAYLFFLSHIVFQFQELQSISYALQPPEADTNVVIQGADEDVLSRAVPSSSLQRNLSPTFSLGSTRYVYFVDKLYFINTLQKFALYFSLFLVGMQNSKI